MEGRKEEVRGGKRKEGERRRERIPKDNNSMNLEAPLMLSRSPRFSKTPLLSGQLEERSWAEIF